MAEVEMAGGRGQQWEVAARGGGGRGRTATTTAGAHQRSSSGWGGGIEQCAPAVAEAELYAVGDDQHLH